MSTLASDSYSVVEIKNLDGDALTVVLRAAADPFFLPNVGDTVRVLSLANIEFKVVTPYYANSDNVYRAAHIPEGIASGLAEFFKVTGHFDQRPDKSFDFYVEAIPLATLSLRERAILFQEAKAITL